MVSAQLPHAIFDIPNLLLWVEKDMWVHWVGPYVLGAKGRAAIISSSSRQSSGTRWRGKKSGECDVSSSSAAERVEMRGFSSFSHFHRLSHAAIGTSKIQIICVADGFY